MSTADSGAAASGASLPGANALPEGVPVIPVPIVDGGLPPTPTSSMPGEHRGGYRQPMTAPVEVTAPVRTEVRWAPAAPAPLPRSAPWALTFAVLGLVVSLLVGWGFLIGVLGAALAIAALRRPWESRPLAVWALCLSILSLLYSAGWLWWASTQGALLG